MCYGGRRMRRDSLHLTLAFLGGVAEERVETLCGIAAGLDLAPFDLHLDQLGNWRHNRIVWAGCNPSSPGFVELNEAAGKLTAVLRKAGFTIEDRPFAAHVTLLRNADLRHSNAPEDSPVYEPIIWQVSGFVLVESQLRENGADYRIIGRWPSSSLDHHSIDANMGLRR